MATDPILTEVRRIREGYAQQFQGDVHAMMEDLRRRHSGLACESKALESKPVPELGEAVQHSGG